MPQVFELIGVQGQATFSQEVVMIVKSYGTIAQSDLFRLCFKSMSWQDFQNAILAGVNSKQIVATNGQHGVTLTYVGEKNG